jgi:hypothetical protein
LSSQGVSDRMGEVFVQAKAESRQLHDLLGVLTEFSG